MSTDPQHPIKTVLKRGRPPKGKGATRTVRLYIEDVETLLANSTDTLADQVRAAMKALTHFSNNKCCTHKCASRGETS
jgi:hypothetical protein